jgi:23S rRNA (cytosine1962-C5)-methyltransferase
VNGSRGPPEVSFFRQAALAASRWREALFGPFGAEERTDAYRLVHGEGDGLGGLVVDAYAGFLVLQVVTESRLEWATLLEEELMEVLRPRGTVRKLRYAKVSRGRVPEEQVHGEKPPEVLLVREEGMPFEVELLGGFHTGLFTDMREERLRLRRLARGRRVLNAFAYTGTLSVAAAVGGAKEVTSVDVVAKVLERAKRNFRLSGIQPEAHRFARMEILEFLRMARRRGFTYDAVILDPPTFATFKSGRWSLKTGYPELLELALSVLDRDGLIWAAANSEGLSGEHFEKLLARGLKRSGRAARTIAIGGLPPDYPTPASRPQARSLKVHVLEVL